MFWKKKIKKAITEDNVVPFYQPIVNSKKQIVKYETLMRLKDIDSKGAVNYLFPDEFYDMAIKTKQYLSLSNQVISKAFNDINSIPHELSLNISFKDIMDEDFINNLDKNLESLSKENKKRVVFELLEGDFISDYLVLEEFISKYRKQGIKIAIDDFGSGYSNFARILKVKPDYIKIDGSLINDLNNDNNLYEMVKSIVGFCKALNITVIAEFIHNEEIFNIARNLGIDEFQGFYLGKPEPLSDKF